LEQLEDRLCPSTPSFIATPLNDLGTGTYHGYQGGLYPGGANVRPAAQDTAGIQLANSVLPLNTSGQPSTQGKVGFLSIGMSNALLEFNGFMSLVAQDSNRNPALQLVNGAEGGMSADRIFNLSTSSARQYWAYVNSQVTSAGLTNAQVEVVWVKEADHDPTQAFPSDATTLENQLVSIMQILHQRFPNLKMAYISSRIYGGYATTNTNPEPFAYESGFAVKWLVQSQINGSTALNFNPAKGPVESPWISWAAYLWADDTIPRSDGLVWLRSDFISDGTHPSASGISKVAHLLLRFFSTDDTAKIWFLKHTSGPVLVAGSVSTTNAPSTSGVTPEHVSNSFVAGVLAVGQTGTGVRTNIVGEQAEGTSSTPLSQPQVQCALLSNSIATGTGALGHSTTSQAALTLENLFAQDSAAILDSRIVDQVFIELGREASVF
jgi:hypothetical protein